MGRRVSLQLPWEAEMYSCVQAFVEQSHCTIFTKARAGGISASEQTEQWQMILILRSYYAEGLVPRNFLTEDSPDCPQFSTFPSFFPESVYFLECLTPRLLCAHLYLSLFRSLFVFTPFLHYPNSRSYLLTKQTVQTCQALKNWVLLICHFSLFLCPI